MNRLLALHLGRLLLSIKEMWCWEEGLLFSWNINREAYGVGIWLEDILKRIPTEKDINQLLPGNWKVLPTNNR